MKNLLIFPYLKTLPLAFILFFQLFVGTQSLATPIHHEVIVVGGGISGLITAYELHKKGVDVLLLEKEDKLGGRLSAEMLEKTPYDLGAQMLPSRSALMLNLVNELNLQNQLVEVSSGLAFAQDGKLYSADLKNPVDVAFSGYFKPWELLNPFTLNKLFKFISTPNHDIGDITKWIHLDDTSVGGWSDGLFQGVLRDKVLEPMLSPIFGNLETTSKSTLFWLYEYVVNSDKIYSLENGLGAISIELSQRIPFKTHSAVSRMSEENGIVHLWTEDHHYSANTVVMATPANVTKSLLGSNHRNIDPTLFDNSQYNSTIVLTLKTDKSFLDVEGLKDTYTILFPRSESRNIHAVAVGSAFGHRLSSNGGNLFQVYFRDSFAKTHMNLTSSQLALIASSEMEKYLPGFSSSITSFAAKKWPRAIPVSYPGKAKRVKDYRRAAEQSQSNILLVGDYLNFPGTEPAARTGKWAATVILKRLRIR